MEDMMEIMEDTTKMSLQKSQNLIGLNDYLPVEMLEEIFKRMDYKTIKSSRQVCSLWNNEILKHSRLLICLRDKTEANRNFLNEVNFPKRLKIFNLSNKNCKMLRTYSLSNVQELIFTLSARITRLNLQYFNDNCVSLTSLTIHKPLLGACDFEKEIEGSIKEKSLFYNLEKLALWQCEPYQDKCNGLTIRNTSKNIQFLLKVIGSQKIKDLTIELNESYMDINCCEARTGYHFEDFELAEFICTLPNLYNLQLSHPPSRPNKLWLPNLPFPTKLNRIAIENRTGPFVAVDGDPEQIIKFPELLEWDPNYYNSLNTTMQAHFWKNLFLAQEKLEIIYLASNYNFGSATFITSLAKNNFTTLREISICVSLNGIIDANEFQVMECLEELCISNNLFESLNNVGDAGMNVCRLINVASLPSTLLELNLLNVCISKDELLNLVDFCTSLERLEIDFEEKNEFGFTDIDDFESVLKKLLRFRNLDCLILTGLNRDPHPGIDQTVDKILHELNNWYDSHDLELSIGPR